MVSFWNLGLLCLLLLAAPSARARPACYSCPFTYERPTLSDITAGHSTPYLYGGIYERPNCPNCKAGGIWPTFCGRMRTGFDYWDRMLCQQNVTQAAISASLQYEEQAQKSGHIGPLTLTPCDLWNLMRGRTLWILGDSMSEDLYRALKCFLVEFYDLRQYHATNNYTVMHHLDDIPGSGRPQCLHMPHNTRLCLIHVITGNLLTWGRWGVLPIITSREIGDPDDIIVQNFGLWHPDKPKGHTDFSRNLHHLGQWYNRTMKTRPYQFYMQTPKQHFASDNGDFKPHWGGLSKGPFTCRPVPGVRLDRQGALQAERGSEVGKYVAAGTWRNSEAIKILQGMYRMPLVAIYNATVPAWAMHRHNHAGLECSHYCHPSQPQLWIYHLYKALLGAKVAPLTVEHAEGKRDRRSCVRVLDWHEDKLPPRQQPPAPAPWQKQQQQQGPVASTVKVAT